MYGDPLPVSLQTAYCREAEGEGDSESLFLVLQGQDALFALIRKGHFPKSFRIVCKSVGCRKGWIPYRRCSCRRCRRGNSCQEGRQTFVGQLQELLIAAFVILCVRSDDQNQIKLRIKEYILAAHSIHGKTIADPPELVAVSLLFIRSLSEMYSRNQARNRFPQIVGKNTGPVIYGVHTESSGFKKVQRQSHQAGSAHFRAKRIGNNISFLGKTQGIQPFFTQIVQHTFSGQLFYQCCQGVAGRSVIHEDLTAPVGRRCDKETFHPVAFHVYFIGSRRVAGFHGQHMADGHIFQPGVNRRSRILAVFRKVINNMVIQGKLSLFQKKTHSQRAEAFCYGKHPMEILRAVGRGIFLMNFLASAVGQKAVNGKSAF